jgi:N-acetylneuraminate synthase
MIAEVAQNHDGSLGAAHAYIDAIAAAGADAVKFQTHIADAESTPGEPWRVRFSPQDSTRYDYWKRMEFTAEQWFGLAQHAADKGLFFLSSAFSPAAFELLDRIGVPAWKVGAGEITNLPLLERMARTGKPVLLSSGLSSWEDLDTAVASIERAGGSYGIFQCTTAYPCPPEKLGLNVIGEIRERYRCPVGLSDHSGTIYAGLAAAALGVEMIEVHAVFSRECFGPDVAASITTAELARLVEGVRFIEKAQAHPVDKQAMARDLSELRIIFGKSIVAARDLPAGRRLSEEDLAFKKPGTGIPAARVHSILNCTLKRAVAANTALSEEDIEQYQAS